MVLVLNNLQRLICHKPHPPNQPHHKMQFCVISRTKFSVRRGVLPLGIRYSQLIISPVVKVELSKAFIVLFVSIVISVEITEERCFRTAPYTCLFISGLCGEYQAENEIKETKNEIKDVKPLSKIRHDQNLQEKEMVSYSSDTPDG